MRQIDGRGYLVDVGYDYIRGLSSFGALSDAGLDFLFEHCEVWEAQTGDRIFDVDDLSDFFIIVLQGAVHFLKFKDGELAYEFNVGPGENTGYIGMITLQPRKGAASVIESGAILKIHSRNFFDFYENCSQDFVVFLMNISRDIGRGFHQVDTLMR